jgi:hypothetical protein
MYVRLYVCVYCIRRFDFYIKNIFIHVCIVYSVRMSSCTYVWLSQGD